MKKFHQLGIAERWQNLIAADLVTPELAEKLAKSPNLSEKQLSVFTENVISQFHLPVGLINGLKVNNQKYLIPIATFEPSVVAALNKATHYLNLEQGIVVTGQKLPITGQIFINYQGTSEVVLAQLKAQKADLKQQGEKAVPHLIRRGGGIKDLSFTVSAHLLVVSVAVDSGEAMGANLVDTIVEKLAPIIAKKVKGEVVSAILSNLPNGTPFKAQASLPVSLIGNKAAQKMEQLSAIAQVNLPRAVTNNKGVMNGLIGAVIATGNDDRAVNAAMSAYLTQQQQFSLTNWQIVGDNLIGTFQGYLPLGTVGGAISTHPDAKNYLALLQVKNSTELSHIIMAVGLASNFSALLALVTTGIQQGHMQLQAKSIALNANVDLPILDAVVSEMIKEQKFDTLTAHEIAEKLKRGKLNDRN